MSTARRPVSSPCISLCRISDETGFCEGCFRTLDEIAGWGAMSDAQRRRVWVELDARRGSSDASDAPDASGTRASGSA